MQKLKELLVSKEKSEVIQPKSSKKKSEKSTLIEPNWIRTTMLLREDHLEKIKAYSFLEGREFKEVIEELLSIGISLKKTSVQDGRLDLLKNLLDEKVPMSAS